MTSTDRLTPARTAFERAAWSEVLDALAALDLGDAAVDELLVAEALELRAQAEYGAGELEQAVTAWEDLHTLQARRGDAAEAARAAAMIAMYLMMDTGLMSPVRGWLATAERFLEGSDIVAAHAIVAMTRTYERFMCGDMDAAREQSELAISLGEATGVTPAVVIGRTARARVRIFDGDLAGGLAALDEVGALLMSGGADPLTTGMMYCEIICAAQGLAMYDMASQWTEVMERWRHGEAFGGINGRCRVHRAEMLRVSGTCEQAETEALGACDELRPWMRREFGWPLAELGTIRLRRGDLAGAEDAFREAHQHAWSPQPGLALLRLAQGDAAGAAAMIAEAIEHPFDIPSKERPPFGDLRLAPLLDAQAEIAFAAGDVVTVRSATERLGEIARQYPSAFLRASTALAGARSAVLEENARLALQASTEAMTIWADSGAPYDAACARLVRAAAYRLAGNETSAEMELTAAEDAFRRFGADAKAAEAVALRAVGAHVASASTTPRANDRTVVTFALEGNQRTIEFDGRSTPLRDLKGFRYLARLVADPGREFHVLDLVAAEEGVLRPTVVHEGLTSGDQDGVPLLDDTAREAYRRRLADIDDDIEDARRMNDPARVELAERDREYLIAELGRAVGLGGRSRTVGGSAERARTAVARSIKYSVDQLAEHQPTLAARLRAGLRTGMYCSYVPDPVSPLDWRL